MSNLIRTFIAIELPSPIQTHLYKETQGLRNKLGHQAVRWVPAENIHLTLKFLGDVSRSNLEILSSMLAREITQHPDFFMEISNFGVFPNVKRPRVIWAGIKAPESLYALQKGVERTTALLGYAPEQHPFHPHLTLGRMRQPVHSETRHTLRQQLAKASIPPLGSIHVTSVTVFQSTLTPQGAMYRTLFNYSLNSEVSN